MPEQKIVVIGSGTAGLAAANTARKADAKAEVTVLSTEKHPPYCKPSLACVVRGTVSVPEEIAIYPSRTLESKNIRLLANREAFAINTKEKTVKMRDISTNRQSQLNYDALVLAVGGHDLVPTIEGANLANVYTLQTFDDALRIYETAGSEKGAIVVGAGPIALSIAESLMKRKIETTMIVRSRVLRTLIEPDLSAKMLERIEATGITCLLNTEIEAIGGSRNVEYVTVAGKKIATSMIVFGTGIRPSTELAEQTGIDVGKFGIQVDDHMRTSVPDIYSAGDCTETIDFVVKKRTYMPIGSIAAQEGTIAGANAAGTEMRTDGFLRIQADNLFGTEITSIGHNSETARALGIEANVSELPSCVRAKSHYCLAGKYPATVKIITDEKDIVIGSQALGRRIATQERFMLFRAIRERMEKEDLVRFLQPHK